MSLRSNTASNCRRTRSMKKSTKKNHGLRDSVEGGFSLVELMVALVIGLLIVLGAGQLYLTSKQSYNRMDNLAKRQESLRVISDLVSFDVRTSVEITNNSADQTVLNMTYDSGVRSNDPYCGSANNLLEVRYSFVSPELMIQVRCDPDASLSSSQSLIEGIEGVNFNVELDASGTTGDGLFVQITVIFPEIGPSEPLEKRQYTFMVARRNNILH